MITGISLPCRAPFTKGPITIDNLKQVCFFFGPNGAGKTTISRTIATEADKSISDVIVWSNNKPIKTYVYNRQFVNQNFADDAAIPGVFTIGKESVNAQEKIEELNNKIIKIQEKINNNEEQLTGAEDDLKDFEDSIRDACWEIKTALPDKVKKIWSGTGRKEKFRDDLIAIVKQVDNISQPDLMDIEHRIDVVCNDTATTVAAMPKIDFSKLINLENDPVLTSKIIGKEKITIANLIKRLGNSDWVAQGRAYISSDDVCPFCQKHTITNEFKTEMNNFFDETYEKDRARLKQISDLYSDCGNKIIVNIEVIIKTYSEFVDENTWRTLLTELKSVLQTNKLLIEKKIANPSVPVTLSSSSKICNRLSALLEKSSNAICAHNEMVAHRTEARKQIINDLWLYTAAEAKPKIVSTNERRKKIEKKINGIKKHINSLNESIQEMRDTLESEEKNLTKVGETAENINALLKDFGFSNFRLAVTENKKYRIERMDGTPVNDTLSEGESNFLSFLYFFHLVNGSQNVSGTADRRIVVVDDPVSSMDADVLFIVSSLVRTLAKEAREGKGKIVQLIMLTHNITFYREVTFIRPGEGDPHTSYYSIRKHGGYSTIERCKKNPVSSTYELLWQNLYQDNCDALTAQNVARRITETFFKFVGGPNLDDVISDIPSPDLEIARSYVAWANAGSHSPFDDETYFSTDENVETYRRVLKTIFTKAGYIDHYNSMTEKYAHPKNS